MAGTVHNLYSTRRRCPPGQPAFTLVEMLTVVAIIILVLGISLPAINAIVRDTNYSSAATQLSGLISMSHSLAVARVGGADRVGLRFDLQDKGGGEVVQRVELMARLPVVSAELGYNPDPRKVNRFVTAAAAGVERQLPVLDFAMPGEVRAAPLKAAVGWSNMAFYDDEQMMNEFHLVFDADGQLVCQEVWIDKNLDGEILKLSSTGTLPRDEYFGGTTLPERRSTRGLVLYELGEYQGLPTATAKQTFLQDRSTTLYVSRFTGQLIGPP